MRLRTYVIRRILLLIPILIGVSVLIFILSMAFSPEQRAVLYAKSPRALRNLRMLVEKYQLRDPAYIQYFNWMNQVLHGDLGWSHYSNMPVVQAIVKHLPATLELVIFSAPLIYIFGTRMGISAAVKRDKPTDHALRLFSIIGWSLPTFWSAILLLSIFYGGFGWFPPGRLGLDASWFIIESPTFVQYTKINTIDALLNGELWIFLDALKHLVLPVLNLFIVYVAWIMRVMRSGMLEALGKGYILTARAKGLDETDVIYTHARKNAMIPVITVSGLMIAGMLSGLVITEIVFDFKGIGFWAANAALGLDIAAILGFSLFVAIVFVITNLIVDVFYAYIDARVRLD